METRNKKKTIVTWCLVVIWAGVIFFMSSREESELDTGDGIFAQIKAWLTQIAVQNLGLDAGIVPTAAHFVEYTVFGVLLFIALWQTLHVRKSGKRTAIWVIALVSIAIASLYGVSDEIHQIFAAGRMCDPADWLTDTLGAALGVLIAGLIHYKLDSRAS